MPSSTYRHCGKMEIWAAEIGWNFSTLSTLVNALQSKCIFKPGSWWLMLRWWELADSLVPLRGRCVLLLMAEYFRNGSLLILRMPLAQDRVFSLQSAHSDSVTGVLLRLGMEAVSCRPRLPTPSVDAPAGTLHQCHVSLSPQVAWAKPCAPPSWASPASPSLAWPCPTCPAAGSQLSCWGCLALTRMPSCRQWGQLCPSPGMPNRWEHLVLCNEELRSERLRQAKVLYVESSNKNTSLKKPSGVQSLLFSVGFGVVGQYLHV